MADELQALLDRINDEGLQKAGTERERVLTAARDESRRLVAEAKTEAQKIVAEAHREADLLQSKGEESLRQAARDVLLSLRGELEVRVVAVAKAVAQASFDAATTGAVIGDLVRWFVQQDGAEGDFLARLSPAQADTIRQALAKGLDDDLRQRVELAPVPGLQGGFRLEFTGSDIVYDCSDTALAETLATFLNPKLAEIVTGNLAK